MTTKCKNCGGELKEMFHRNGQPVKGIDHFIHAKPTRKSKYSKYICTNPEPEVDKND